VTTSYILDTGPLSTLCSFPLNGSPYIYTVLKYASVLLADGVITEAGRGKIWRTVSPLINTGEIKSISSPIEPEILDTSYGNDLGLGERSTIKLGLKLGLITVIDDRDAFVVANRFGIHPIGFQDWVVKLVQESDLSVQTAIEIVKASAKQYPKMYLAHTLQLLSSSELRTK